MATSRFPKAKYLRQLRTMEEDISFWRLKYLEAAVTTTSDHLAGRFSARAYVLEDVELRAHELREMLGALPRIT